MQAIAGLGDKNPLGCYHQIAKWTTEPSIYDKFHAKSRGLTQEAQRAS